MINAICSVWCQLQVIDMASMKNDGEDRSCPKAFPGGRVGDALYLGVALI